MKRRLISLSSRRPRETAGLRDGDAAKRERRGRAIGLARATVVRARSAQRIGCEALRPRLGSALPSKAKPPRRNRSRPSPEMAAHARARLSDPGRGVQGSRQGDLAAPVRERPLSTTRTFARRLAPAGAARRPAAHRSREVISTGFCRTRSMSGGCATKGRSTTAFIRRLWTLRPGTGSSKNSRAKRR